MTSVKRLLLSEISCIHSEPGTWMCLLGGPLQLPVPFSQLHAENVWHCFKIQFLKLFLHCSTVPLPPPPTHAVCSSEFLACTPHILIVFTSSSLRHLPNVPRIPSNFMSLPLLGLLSSTNATHICMGWTGVDSSTGASSTYH